MIFANFAISGRLGLLGPLALLLALGLVPGCRGATEVVLTADRTTISAGGTDFATLTAQALIYGDPVKAGTPVTFDNSYAEKPGALGAPKGPSSLDQAADGTGTATVKLYSNASQGSTTVVASFYDYDSGASAESSITITFGPPSGKQRPVDGTFRMSCDAVNIGALRLPTPDIKVTCQLSAQNRAGQALPSSAFNPTFLTEAGSITAKDDYYTGKRIFIYSPKGGASTPKDVTPLATLNEPSYFDKNGKKRNPRDGLVTLVAVVDGEEAFTDLNGNGDYDSGEPFTEAAEPFVDADDDDKKGATERYLDVNGNGRWDQANGKWDASTKIMAIYKILWTGAVDSSQKTSRFTSSAGGSFDIADKGKVEIVATLLDANLNPVAAFSENSDYLEWTLDAGNSYAYSGDATSVTLKNTLGFTFDATASTERKRWLITGKSFAPPTYKYTVTDSYPDDGTTETATYSVSVAAYLTPGPAGEGSYTTQVTDKIGGKAEGTCD